jgi:hypothetical protein
MCRIRVISMQFFNGTSLRDIANRELSVYILIDGGVAIAMIEDCQAFLVGPRLYVDLSPQLNRKYSAPVPVDAVISRNEIDLVLGRHGVFVSSQSPLGQLALWLLGVKHKGSRSNSRPGMITSNN